MLVVVVVVFFTGGFYVSGLLFLATSTPPSLFRPVKASSSSEFYPGYFRLLYFTSSPHFWHVFVTQMRRAGTPHPGSSSVLALTELSLPADAWT